MIYNHREFISPASAALTPPVISSVFADISGERAADKVAKPSLRDHPGNL
jgi:hypothetical protein